jgi:hypothetical protein
VPPEVLVRAFVIGYAYGIPSFRKLCAAIEENLAFRWFLFLGLEDEVFDPSTITVFLRRLGPPATPEAFADAAIKEIGIFVTREVNPGRQARQRPDHRRNGAAAGRGARDHRNRAGA